MSFHAFVRPFGHLLLLAGVLAATAPRPAAAQTTTGTIRGSVKSASGGALADAEVQAKNVATGVVRTASAHAGGPRAGVLRRQRPADRQRAADAAGGGPDRGDAFAGLHADGGRGAVDGGGGASLESHRDSHLRGRHERDAAADQRSA